MIIYNGKIILIRPKMWMANDGNYVSHPDENGKSTNLVEGIKALHSLDEI